MLYLNSKCWDETFPLLDPNMDFPTKQAIDPDKVPFQTNSLIFFLFLHKNIHCGTHWKRLAEVLLMSTHNKCFCGEIRKKIKLFVWKGTLSGYSSYL